MHKKILVGIISIVMAFSSEAQALPENGTAKKVKVIFASYDGTFKRTIHITDQQIEKVGFLSVMNRAKPREICYTCITNNATALDYIIDYVEEEASSVNLPVFHCFANKDVFFDLVFEAKNLRIKPLIKFFENEIAVNMQRFRTFEHDKNKEYLGFLLGQQNQKENKKSSGDDLIDDGEPKIDFKISPRAAEIIAQYKRYQGTESCSRLDEYF